jgi:paired amphipathic helix protein Sin3a
LYQLYRYEVARGEPPKDATYFANAHVLLHDDTCFRFASLPGNQVSFQMMDPDKSEVPAGILEPSFALYLRNFTEHSAPQPDPAAKLFLLRNFPDGQAADPGAMPPAAGVELTNGLECKIATATSKVSYVLDTEDVFRRHRRQQGAQASPDAAAQRVGKFRGWVDEKARLRREQAAVLEPWAPMLAAA